MTPTNKQTILRSYECQLKASSKPETKKALESLITDIKGIHTSNDLKVIYSALDCTLALEKPYNEGITTIMSHGLKGDVKPTIFSNSLCQLALDIMQNPSN
jgi:hypothetical protein